MGEGILYRCPECREAMGSDPGRCGACGSERRTARVGGTTVVDFLGRTTPGRCECEYVPTAPACEVDLRDIRVAEAVRPRRHFKAKLLRRYMKRGGRVVLDIGCREAPIGHLLAGENTVVGVDLCPRTMLTGDASALGKGYRALLLADAEDLPIADEQADLVLATDLLEHALVPERMLSEFRRVLKPGGELLVTVPNLVSFNNRVSICLGYGAGLELHRLLTLRSPFLPLGGPRYPDQRLHIRWFTRNSLARVLKATGFRVRSMRGYDAFLSRVPFADRLLRSFCTLVAAFAERE